MSGMAIMVTGFGILVLATAGATVAEWVIHRKKQRMREQIYHIYR